MPTNVINICVKLHLNTSTKYIDSAHCKQELTDGGGMAHAASLLYVVSRNCTTFFLSEMTNRKGETWYLSELGMSLLRGQSWSVVMVWGQTQGSHASLKSLKVLEFFYSKQGLESI